MDLCMVKGNVASFLPRQQASLSTLMSACGVLGRLKQIQRTRFASADFRPNFIAFFKAVPYGTSNENFNRLISKKSPTVNSKKNS